MSRAHFTRRAALSLFALPVIALAGCPSASPPRNSPPPGAVNSPTANGGAPQAAGGGKKIMFITNGISPFWDPMGVGIQKASTELNVNAEWQGPQNAQLNEQRQLIEQAKAGGADAIGVSSIEADAITPVIDELVDGGTLVFTFDSDAPKSKRKFYIGTDNFQAGKVAGEAALKLLPNGGNVVAFVGNQSAQNARERIEGFKEATKGKITVLDVFDDNKDIGRARKNVEDAIQKYGAKINGFLGVFSYNGPQIAEAVKQAKIRDKVKIVAFDAEEGTINALRAGDIDVMIVQKPYEFGYQGAQIANTILNEGWDAAVARYNIKDGKVDTGVEAVTTAGLEDFQKRLADKGIKTS